ncbi:ABC transporter ATP-binding protein [uncultured Selenomonas sp.]|uniref:ABC transporter ATP-binding protein n=1 Tax=uncultured Selenomonas sp. TaxID=159275 RepID=UPI00258362B3|nr:ABC transporter ATP-binding protein [uncultured Selenomonas sp.]
MIKLHGVSKRFAEKEALKDISLTIEKGETVAIIGGSGSGKSTLLRLMIGLDRPTAGEICVGTDNIAAMDETALDRVRLRMGMVFQYSALFDSMSVGENVAFGLREHTDKTEDEIRRIVAEKLELVGLPGVEHLMPQELSGGMKKRVGLARAIATNPEIIFYDEPSSGLDPIMTAKIDELIIDMQKKLDVTSVVVTHDMASASRIADRIAMIYDGTLIAVDTPERVQEIDDARVQAFFRTLHHRKESGA